MKEKIIKMFMGRFSGPITAWGVGAITAYLLSLLATAPEWARELVNGLVEAVSQGEFSEANVASLTAILTPIIAALMTAGINFAKDNGIRKIQKENNVKADGWVGPETLDKTKKK